ncbi:MAG: TIGR03915 family putative DNA repair protein [Culturomica sp.]|jgi:probable DNA metabolism protein|nr:TIGR03915 family putative DNA repair protein [Culturomica sp.]
MIVCTYDKTFEGLLSVVFEAYSRKKFPDKLLAEGEPLPLFYDEAISVSTDPEKSERVWNGLEKKLSRGGLAFLTQSWLSELPEVDLLLFRYIRKNLDAPVSLELNFGDPDVLEVSQIWKKVGQEKSRIIQFARFQKTADNTYLAVLEPLYNVLPLTLSYFKERFAGQCWLLYDNKRKYGYYYDMKRVSEVRFEQEPLWGVCGKLPEELLAEDEKQFQQLWKSYFKSLAIRERLNPKLHRQHLPARFWKYLTEKQGG